jgi:long-chain acyl-CoA synthetase
MSQLSVRRFPARNLPALLRLSAQQFGSRRFIREIDPDNPKGVPVECSFEQFERDVAATAEFLSGSGIKPFDRVLIVAENSRDYQVLALAAQALRAEPCSVFANLGANATSDIAERVRPRCLFVSSQSQWDKLTQVSAALVKGGLAIRISPKPLAEPLDGVTDCLISQITSTPYSPKRWNERVDAIGPDDPFLLLFTSGTSGKQKGVVLRQDAFVRAIEGGRAGTGMSENDDGLMFLPFGHIAGQCQFMLAIALGHSLILVSRRDDLAVAFSMGPSYAFAVPMVYEKLLARVTEQLEGLPWPLRPLLSASITAAQRSRPKGTTTLKDRALAWLAKRTIGERLKRNLGGRLRMVASGGASTPPSLCQFFETMGIPFISIYGMSETCGLICSQGFGDERYNDSVGLPSPDLEVKINDQGELCLKGAMMMQGYLESEDNTDAYDEQGYFRTGDLVTRNSRTGQYRIIGRSKSLLILSTGKKISPEPIETQLDSVWPITGAVLLGDGHPYVTALLFVPATDIAKLGRDEDAVFSSLQVIVASHLAEFSDYERPKRLLVVEGSPTDHPEFVTPTLKLKRKPIIDAYASAIEQLYELKSTNGFVYRS